MAQRFKIQSLRMPIGINIPYKINDPLDIPEEIDFEELILGDIIMPRTFNFAPLSSRLSISQTPIASGIGNVKESFSIEDWEFTISVLAINEEEEDLPRDFIESIIELYLNPQTVSITNEFFNLHNIQNVILISYSLSAVGLNWARLELGFVSDEPVELELEQF